MGQLGSLMGVGLYLQPPPRPAYIDAFGLVVTWACTRGEAGRKAAPEACTCGCASAHRTESREDRAMEASRSVTPALSINLETNLNVVE